MSEFVSSLLGAQAVASFVAALVWLTSAERLSGFAWRLAHRERRPANCEAWSDELDARSAMGESPRRTAFAHLGRGVKLRVASWLHPIVLWRQRVQDTTTGTLLIISKMDVAIEVSIAADKGGPKDTWEMAPHTTYLFPTLVEDTTVLVTVTRSAQPVRYWETAEANDRQSRTDGRLTIRPRRRRPLTRRRRANAAVFRPAHFVG